MHRGRPFELEQTLRSFAANNIYSVGWPAKAYALSLATYTGSSAVFVTIPTPDITLESMDPDGLGGDYTGRIADPMLADLKVGFHFRFNLVANQAEAWIQTYFNGQRALNEPTPGTNFVSYAWNPYSAFLSNPGGPFANQIRPTRLIFVPKPY